MIGHNFGDNIHEYLAPCIYEGEGEMLALGFFKSLVKTHGRQFFEPIGKVIHNSVQMFFFESSARDAGLIAISKWQRHRNSGEDRVVHTHPLVANIWSHLTSSTRTFEFDR